MSDFDAATILSLIKDIRDLSSTQRASMRPSPVQNQPLIPGEDEIPKSSGQYQAPIRGSYQNSGDFSPGRATDPRHKAGHQGVDLRASGGTSVYPMAPGLVVSVGTDPKGGNIVLIQHDNGVKTYSAHLGTVDVHKGDKVEMDTVIGTVGNSGNARVTWPHVHFQVWVNGQLTNPAQFFAVPKYSSPTANEQEWLPGAKEQADRWSMSEHLQRQRIAFTTTVNQLQKVCNGFFRLTAS